MADVYWSKRNVCPGAHQNLIFIGDMSITESGYGLCDCPHNSYHIVPFIELSSLIERIRADRRHIERTINDELVSPIHREIDRLENEQSTSRGLTWEVRKLLEILPEPSLN